MTAAGAAATIHVMAGTPHAGQSRPRNHSATPADAAESGLSLVNPAWLLIGFTLATIAAGTALLALPISASSGGASLLDALFTATSAATTTGLVVVDTPTFWSYTGHNVVMWLVIAGGAGSLIGSTMLLLLIASRVADEDRFLLKEFTGVQSPRGMVLLITGILVYAFLVQWGGSYVMARELSATMPEGVAGWFARFHAVTAFNNAGFDIMDMGKNTPPAMVQLLLTSLSLLGAVGFIVVIDLFKGITRRHLAL
ncbi:MAG: hypothetical protein HYY32_05315, partial [Chloroflexi bacterium]|nr:hypothetical protein [Chloroflexota bacterium]